MTNILKDIWDDRERGACWLPQSVFEPRGIRLSTLKPGEGDLAFAEAMGDLIGVAHGHLRNALEYTLRIPARETGMRKFCLWALGMAVLTLRKLNANRNYRDGNEVKISRRAVKATVATTTLTARSNLALRGLFAACSLGLPQQRVEARLPDLSVSPSN